MCLCVHKRSYSQDVTNPFYLNCNDRENTAHTKYKEPTRAERGVGWISFYLSSLPLRFVSPCWEIGFTYLFCELEERQKSRPQVRQRDMSCTCKYTQKCIFPVKYIFIGTQTIVILSLIYSRVRLWCHCLLSLTSLKNKLVL